MAPTVLTPPHPALPSLFNHPYQALVIGATGAMGSAFVNAFQADPHCTQVLTVARDAHSGFDVCDAASIAQAAERCRSGGPCHIIIDATGALTIDGTGPEKSLASVQAPTLLRNMHINAVGPVLVLQQFAPLLASGPAIYAKLSARVGSISDNKKGGWYGYRAAKAALNMLLQTAAIELQRKNPALRVVAMQPGTVRSKLSQPFLAAVPEVLEPHTSVQGLWQALQSLLLLPPMPGAHFIDHKGQRIAW